jgi:hypothetical protein
VYYLAMNQARQNRVAFFRDRAEQARTKAESMKDELNRRMIFDLATTWERMADREEQNENWNRLR